MSGTILAPEEREQIVSILHRHLERRAAALLHTDRRTLYRAGLGLPLRRNAAECIRARLRVIAAAEGADVPSQRASDGTALSRAAAKRIRREGLPAAARALDVDAADLLGAAIGDFLPEEVAAKLERALLPARAS